MSTTRRFFLQGLFSGVALARMPGAHGFEVEHSEVMTPFHAQFWNYVAPGKYNVWLWEVGEWRMVTDSMRRPLEFDTQEEATDFGMRIGAIDHRWHLLYHPNTHLPSSCASFVSPAVIRSAPRVPVNREQYRWFSKEEAVDWAIQAIQSVKNPPLRMILSNDDVGFDAREAHSPLDLVATMRYHNAGFVRGGLWASSLRKPNLKKKIALLEDSEDFCNFVENLYLSSCYEGCRAQLYSFRGSYNPLDAAFHGHEFGVVFPDRKRQVIKVGV